MRSGLPVVPARVAGLALAVILLAVALVTLLAGGGDPEVRLTAGGPVPAGDTPSTAAGGQPPAPPDATTTTNDRLRVEAVHGRTSPGEPPASPPAPDVRTPSSDPSGSTTSPVLVPPPSTTVAPAAGAAEPCPRSAVKVTVATDRAAYGPGQGVQGSSSLENRSATACLLPTRAFFRITNGAGKDVGSFAYTLEFRLPVRAEPGKTFTSTFTWDQKDCAGSACAQVPPGTYAAVADWTESGPYTGTTTFQVTS